jgi:prevent-host-death family protein
MRWQVQEAKQRFSEVLRAAEEGEPQIVTRHGHEIAVVIEIGEYHRLRGEVMSFMEFLSAPPYIDVDLEIERTLDPPRELDLSD